MTDDSYHMPICFGIGMGISIGKFLALYLVSKVSEKSGIGTPLIYIYIHIYHFDTLDQRKRRADKSSFAYLSVLYTKYCTVKCEKKYRTLILINTFHSIIKFLRCNFDENC